MHITWKEGVEVRVKVVVEKGSSQQWCVAVGVIIDLLGHFCAILLSLPLLTCAVLWTLYGHRSLFECHFYCQATALMIFDLWGCFCAVLWILCGPHCHLRFFFGGIMALPYCMLLQFLTHYRKFKVVSHKTPNMEKRSSLYQDNT